MKKLIIILALLLPFFGFSQIKDEYYRVADWTFYPDSVIQLTDTTYSVYATPANYNDPGAIERIVGNYVVDFVGHRYVVIDSTTTYLTLYDIYQTGQAPQTGQIAHCYRSVGNGEAQFIGSVDYSTLDESARWKINGADNELMWQRVENKVPFLGADRDVDLGANSISTDTVKIDGVPLLLNTFKQGNLGGANNIFYSTGASSQPASGSVNQVVGNNYVQNQNSAAQSANMWISGNVKSGNGIETSGGHIKAFSNAIAGIDSRFLSYTNTSNSGGRNWAFGANGYEYGDFTFFQSLLKDEDPTVSSKLILWLRNTGDAIFSNTIQATTAKLTNLTNGYIPNTTTNGLVNSPIYSDGTDVFTRNSIGLVAIDESIYGTIKAIPRYGSLSNIPASIGFIRDNFDGFGGEGAIVFKTGIDTPTPAERMRISSNGNVGINTTTPLSKLSINGGLHVGGDGDAGDNNILADGTITGTQLISNIPTGTPPLVVASSTKVDSLNAGLLDGKKASDFQLQSDTTTFDATLSDLQDSASAIRALANTKAVVSGTDNYIPKITGANSLGNSFLLQDGSFLKTNVDFKFEKSVPGFYFKDSHSSYSGFFYVYDSIFGIQKRDYITDGYISRPYAFSLAAPGNTINANNLGNVAFGHGTALAKLHPISTGTQARLGYNANKYTDLTTNSAGTFNISPSGGFTNFSGGISASAYSTFSGQVEMTGLDVNLGASTVLRKNGLDIFTAPITMGACGSAGQVLTSTGINSAPTWTTPATGSSSGITSIGIQVPTGLTVNPSSLTANGTFTFGLQSGYSIPTTTKQTQWDLAYYYRIQNVTGSNPLTLEMSGTTLTGYLNNTLSMFGTTTRSTGYLYWNGSAFSYQAATTTYTLPTATANVLGGVKVATDDGGLYMSGGFLLQKDNVLTTRTPELSDYIAFYDNSATAQGKMTLSTLGSLIGGSGGGMVYPGAGIPVSTGSAWGTSKTAPSGTIVGTTDSQALTNKSVNGVTLSTGAGATNFLAGDGTYKAVLGGVGTSTSGQLLYNNSDSVGGIGLYNLDSLLVNLDYNGLKAERIIASFDNPQYTVKGEDITFGDNWESIVGGSSGLQNGEMGSAFMSADATSLDVNSLWNWFMASNSFTNMLLSGTIQLTSYNITDDTYNFKTYNVVIKRLGTTISYLSKTEISSVGTDTTALSNTISADYFSGYYTTALYIDRNKSKQHNIRMIFTGSIMPLIKI